MGKRDAADRGVGNGDGSGIIILRDWKVYLGSSSSLICHFLRRYRIGSDRNVGNNETGASKNMFCRGSDILGNDENATG